MKPLAKTLTTLALGFHLALAGASAARSQESRPGEEATATLERAAEVTLPLTGRL